jgi:hypothetical protein
MRERWLVISYFANIDAMAPSHHIDDRLPSLARRGIEICLLTSVCGAPLTAPLHKRIPSIAPSGIRYEVRHFLRRKTKRKLWYKFWQTFLLLPVYPFYFLEKIFLRLDSTWSWFVTASVAATILCIKNRPRIIYSTGGPVSAHLAAMIASSLTRTPYAAEFQDPLVNQHAAPHKCERLFLRRVERLVMKSASLVIFLTEKAMENSLKRNPVKGKAVAIYPGAVPSDHAPRYISGGRCNVAHFGSLGDSRNLEYIFRALSSLNELFPDLSAFFTLHLYGANAANVRKQIDKSPCVHLLEIHGKVRRQEAARRMHDSDVLLLIQNIDESAFEQIPLKTYEYLSTGRPILALVYRNPELQAMLEERGHIVVQADDVAAIREGFMTYIGRWRGNLLQGSPAKSPYTVEEAVSRLIEAVAATPAGEAK